MRCAVGYRVTASGTHGGLFSGWIMPEWLRANPGARADQSPDESESEWEEMRD